MQYRQARTAGGTYFFTVVTYDRQPILCTPNSINILKNAFQYVIAKHPFTVEAMVVLPDHLHCIWAMPDGDRDFSTRWRLIKSKFTRDCDKNLRQTPSRSRRDKQEQAIWQRRFWEHLIRDDTDYLNHVEYIHYNPVKHEYVGQPGQWPHSTFDRFVRDGLYSRDWGGNGIIINDMIGKE